MCVVSEDKVVCEVTEVSTESPHVGGHDSQVVIEVAELFSLGPGLAVGYKGSGRHVTAYPAIRVFSRCTVALVVVANFLGEVW